jgi:hypothetical protein
MGQVVAYGRQQSKSRPDLQCVQISIPWNTREKCVRTRPAWKTKLAHLEDLFRGWPLLGKVTVQFMDRRKPYELESGSLVLYNSKRGIRVFTDSRSPCHIMDLKEYIRVEESAWSALKRSKRGAGRLQDVQKT